MAKVKTERLKPGMVVDSDIKNLDGMLLLPAGCELTERHIDILMTWGIMEISIQETGEDQDGDLAEPPIVIPPEMESAMKARYWAFDEASPVQQEILRLLLIRKVKSQSPA